LIEIEVKVRVEDAERVKKGLFARGIYEKAYEKDDTYWVFPEANPGKKSGPALPAAAPDRIGKKGGAAPDPGQGSPGGGLPPSGLRVRRETNTGKDGEVSAYTLITYKTREIREGVEINDEREFEVSAPGGAQPGKTGAEVFEDLLRRLGLVPGIKKNKRGWAWRCEGTQKPANPAKPANPGGSAAAGGTGSGIGAADGSPGPEVLAELSEVKGLGWFLELEILAPRGDKKTLAESRKRLFSLLEALKIPKEQIETRPYTEMLRGIQDHEGG
jgi:adenylate cyclase class 2